jgi:Protein of unknown function (DUF3604)
MNTKIAVAMLASASLTALTGCNKAAPGSYSTETQATTSVDGAKVDGAYLPDPNRQYPTRVLWGDQHLHTGWSADAGLSGAILGPEEAVRFVRGETVKSNTGKDAKLEVPLDWVAVTDHSDAMGVISELRAGNPAFSDPQSKSWYQGMKAGGERAAQAMNDAISAQATHKLPKVFMDPNWMVSAWTKTIDIMEKYNEPGKFTAFIGYEWTSNGVAGDNLHRNVILRDDGDKARQVLPLTTFQSSDPASLWKWLAAYEASTGGQVLAIPHNGNLSNGRMFEEQQYDGKPMAREWAATRARWEPLFEYYQYKGQSEAHPSLSPTDEFANFELWDTANLDGQPKKPGMIRTEYAREALKNGMAIEAKLGANPFKFGAAAGTDTHTGLSTPIENNYWGKYAVNEPEPDRWKGLYRKEQGGYIRRDWTQSPMGYTGVWATSNTREALWDAMKRKETYASTGPRITVRFFGGYDFSGADAAAGMMVANGYARGVPMGGDLKPAAAGKVPTFLIAATKDPRGANLDRAQIIKGWVDAAGKSHEAVYDVVWSDPAKRKAINGKLPDVGDTIDLATATYTNTIGASELIGSFKDPSFDPKQRAFYYVRVLEIPTPRWTAHDAAKFQVKMTPDVKMKVRERAVTSPIWYTPQSMS